MKLPVSRRGSKQPHRNAESLGDHRPSVTPKTYCGMTSHIIGGSEILTAHHIGEIEPVRRQREGHSDSSC